MLEKRILKILNEHCEDVDFTSSKKLIDDGLLDSINTVIAISAIAEEIGVNIPFEEVTAENFNSVKSITALVEKYLKQMESK